MRKRNMLLRCVACGMLLLVGCGGVKTETYVQLQADYNALQLTAEQLRNDYDNLTEDYDELKDEYEMLKEEKEKIEQEYTDYQTEMQPYYEYVMGLQNQQNVQTQQDAGANIPQYSNMQIEQMLKEYDTGITYEQLVTEPDTYNGQKFKVSGQIIVTNADNKAFTFLLAVDGDMSKIMLFSAETEWRSAGFDRGSSVTVYGTSAGLFDYDLSFLEEYLASQQSISLNPEIVSGTEAAITPTPTLQVPEETPMPKETPTPEETPIAEEENTQEKQVPDTKIPGASADYIV